MEKPFATAYPNVAQWIDVQGWIEIGQDEFSSSLVRCLDIGGMVWESSEDHETMDEALQALEKILGDLLPRYT